MTLRRVSGKNWVPSDAQVQTETLPSEAEVLDEALHLLEQRDLKHTEEKARVEALLIAGLDSGPSTPMTSGDWDEIERAGRRIIAARRARKGR
jgi:Arc/MetJ-type ribon-helix-helix transcriptional regulator